MHWRTEGIRSGRGILIVDPQGFGDVVMSIPLLRAVCDWAADRWPVYVLLQSEAHFALLEQEKLRCRPLFIKPHYQGVGGMARLRRDLKDKVDVVIAHPEISPRKLVAFRIALGASYLFGEATPPWSRWFTDYEPGSWTTSMLKAQERIAARMGLPVPLGPPAITVTKSESDWATRTLAEQGFAGAAPLVGLHASAIVPQKTWPGENFGLVIADLQKRNPGMAVISFGVESEMRDIVKARTAAGDVPWLEGAGRWTVRQSLAMLRQCDVFLSGDTGLMHMAAAVGCPTVSVFGPTSPERRAPRHNNGKAVFPQVPCHPCFRGRLNACACIQRVPVGEVLEAAMRQLHDAPIRVQNEGVLEN